MTQTFDNNNMKKIHTVYRMLTAYFFAPFGLFCLMFLFTLVDGQSVDSSFMIFLIVCYVFAVPSCFILHMVSLLLKNHRATFFLIAGTLLGAVEGLLFFNTVWPFLLFGLVTSALFYWLLSRQSSNPIK